jgi:1-acyl-sn-glycerol-3-phosphate acyltransferase
MHLAVICEVSGIMSKSSASSKNKYTTLSDNQLKWPHWVFQWLSIQILHLYYRLSHRIRVFGLENVPKEWFPCIMACNHTSSMDPPLVSIALNYRPISYMAKMELFQTPALRAYNWAMSSFAVNREKLELSTVKTALKVLQHGKWAVGIFPEGTRNKEGTLQAAKKGVAYFAKAAQVPVLPLAIVHSIKKGKKTIDIQIGTLIPPDNDLDALTATIQNSIASLIEQASQIPG